MEKAGCTYVLVLLFGALLTSAQASSSTLAAASSVIAAPPAAAAAAANSPVTDDVNSFICSSSADCPSDYFYFGCQGSIVTPIRDHYRCVNHVCVEVSAPRDYVTCPYGYLCMNGQIQCAPVAMLSKYVAPPSCVTNLDCMPLINGRPYCLGEAVMQNITSGQCVNPFLSHSYCKIQTRMSTMERCGKQEYCHEGLCLKREVINPITGMVVLNVPAPTTLAAPARLVAIGNGTSYWMFSVVVAAVIVISFAAVAVYGLRRNERA